MAKAVRQQHQPESFSSETVEEVSLPTLKDVEEESLISKVVAKNEKPKQKIPKEPEVYIFKLLTGASAPPPRMSVSNEMPIFDVERGENRTIRLLRGVASIYVDEQIGLTPQYVQRNKMEISFVNGILRVPRTNRTVLNFLLNSDEYDGKAMRMRTRKPVFTLINSEAIEEAELAKEQLKFEAIKYAMSAKEEDMIPHAMFLKVNMINNYGEQKSPAKIRVEYAAVAAAKPEYFMKTANSPIMKAAFFVQKGIESGVIDITKRQGYAVWAESGIPIVELKFGKPIVEIIAEYAMSESEEAKAFYKQLKAVL